MTLQIIDKAQEPKAETSSAGAGHAWHALPKVASLEQLRRRAEAVPPITVSEGSLLVANGLVLTKKSRSFVQGWTLLENKSARAMEVDLREGGV